MKPKFLQPVLVTFLVGLACGVLLLPGCQEKSTSTTTPQSLTTTTSTAGSASASTQDAISAKQAFDLMLSKAKGWAADAMLLSLGAEPRNSIIEKGLCNYWLATFYSPSSKEVYSFNYYKDKYMKQPQLGRANKPLYQGVTWKVADLQAAWKIDSPEAQEIATQQGLGEIVSMTLSLRVVQPDRNPPQVVPESCTAYWEVGDKQENTVFIDATTGAVYK